MTEDQQVEIDAIAATSMRDQKIVRRVTVGLAVVVGMLGIALALLGRIVDDTHDTVNIIQRQTSPEALARRQAETDEILIRLDCNNRAATQELIDALVLQGLIQPVDILSRCKNVPK